MLMKRVPDRGYFPHLCAGLEAGIEGVTHAVGQRRLARVRERREGAEEAEEVARDGEEERGGIAAGLSILL